MAEENRSKGRKRFFLALAALAATSTIAIITLIEHLEIDSIMVFFTFFGNLTTMAYVWFFKDHTGENAIK